MFKPHFGTCICHNKPNLIVVKAGFCKQGNEDKKQKTKKQIQKVIKKMDSVPSLVAELDTQFSIFIRRREADENGFTKCVTCPNMDFWKDMDCGHYHSRRYYAIRWEETNCGVQCTRCNIYQEGNKPAFTTYLTRTYGEQILQTLEIKKNNKFKLERFTLITLINHYKNLNNGKS